MLLRTTFAAMTIVTLAATASAKPVTLSAETNLRAAPGTKSDVVTLMPKGSDIEVGECDAGWCKVKFGDKEGFAIGRNLGEAPPPATTASTARPQNPADLQRLRRGYEQYFDDGQNDRTPNVPTQRGYSQRDQQYYDDGRNDLAADVPTQQQPRRYSQRTQPRTEDYDDDDDAPAVVYGRPAYVPGPPVYYSYYYPFPRPYYYGPRVYYRRW